MVSLNLNLCTCAVCGATIEASGVSTANIFTRGKDLDLRPAGKTRFTMDTWMQECPTCGYVSQKISTPTRVTKGWLNSEKYLTCDGISFGSNLAKQFYKYYMINLEDRKINDAFFAILHAAWACDDEDSKENAKLCRKMAISLATELINENYSEHRDSFQLYKADLMRRAGQFDELIASYESVHFDNIVLDLILKFQIEKAKDKDDSCYNIRDVIICR